MSQLQASHWLVTRLALLMVAATALSSCEKTPSKPGTKTPASASASAEELPAAFDRAASIISADAYKLAECVSIADDKEKLRCYAALGFTNRSDVEKVEAFAGRMDVMSGKRWQITAPGANEKNFQGSAYLTFASLKNEGALPFRGARIRMQCPATWGNSANRKWAASVDVPFQTGYTPDLKVKPGTMVIDVDGRQFPGKVSSRSTLSVDSEHAVGLRDAIIGGRNMSLSVATTDGKTGNMTTMLPNSSKFLKAYFDKFCA